MRLQTYIYTSQWNKRLDTTLDSHNTLIILFSTYSLQRMQKHLPMIRNYFPQSNIIGCSSAGNIYKDEINEDSIVIAVMNFSKTLFKLTAKNITDTQGSKNIAKEIAQELYTPDLKSIFVLSDGLHVNGSQFTDAMQDSLPNNIFTSGALAGDDGSFEHTWTLLNDTVTEHQICAVAFYSDTIEFKTSYKDGLDPFGIQRIVTRSKDNILYELDHKPALEIYKTYLGEKAQQLPLSGLYFPILIQTGKDQEIIRTILAVDEESNSITFAGDIPEGSLVTFMKANYDRVINAAEEAASALDLSHYNDEALLNIAISCIGRKLILKQRTEEELEVMLEVLPKKTHQIGMYSFGEISPTSNRCCDLHNQTMTLTAIWEKDA